MHMIVTDDLDSTVGFQICFSNLVDSKYIMNIIIKDSKERYAVNQLHEYLEKGFEGGRVCPYYKISAFGS